MSVNKRAVCPLCTRTTATFTHNERRIYVQHYATLRGRANVRRDGVCEASGWLVEDDELVVVPRRPSPASGVAQPARSSWHCAGGVAGSAGCRRSAPCTDLCRTIPDAPPPAPSPGPQESER